MSRVWLCLLTAATVWGQTTDVTIRSFPKRFVKDEAKLWTSPFRKSSYDSKSFKKYVIPFVVISGALIATDRHTGNADRNIDDQAMWSGRVSQMGAWYSLAGVSGGSYLVGRFGGNDRLQETGLLAMEAIGHNQIAVFALKRRTNRQRPLSNRLKANKEDKLAWAINNLRPFWFTLYLKPLKKITQFIK